MRIDEIGNRHFATPIQRGHPFRCPMVDLAVLCAGGREFLRDGFRNLCEPREPLFGFMIGLLPCFRSELLPVAVDFASDKWHRLRIRGSFAD